jgi:hypothetical protein
MPIFYLFSLMLFEKLILSIFLLISVPICIIFATWIFSRDYSLFSISLKVDQSVGACSYCEFFYDNLRKEA